MTSHSTSIYSNAHNMGLKESKAIEHLAIPPLCGTDTALSRHHRNVEDDITLIYSKNQTEWMSQPDDYEFVWIYISPVILILGIVGNLLTFIVMRQRRLRSTTASVYLTVMSVADTLALISRIAPEFFKSIQLFTFSDLNGWTCKLEKFTFYTSSDVAIWLLVAFTFDRLIAVCFPLHKRRVCVTGKAWVATVIILTSATLKNGHVFFSRDVTESTYYKCGWVAPFLFFEEFVRGWIAFALVSAIPFIFILVCNCLIIRTLTFVGRLSTTSSTYLSTSTATTKRGTSFAQTSWMCLSVSLTFLACVTPSIILSIGRAYWSVGEHKASYNLARAINNQLACVNHAVNFFLYCLTGQRFRAELLRLFHLGSEAPSPVAVLGAMDAGMGSMTALNYGWTLSVTPPNAGRSSSTGNLQVMRGVGASRSNINRSPRMTAKGLAYL